jgi:hypothetical protein
MFDLEHSKCMIILKTRTTIYDQKLQLFIKSTFLDEFIQFKNF